MLKMEFNPWAIKIDQDWADGESFLHDGVTPWLFSSEAAAWEKAKEAEAYRLERNYPPARYRPVQVRVRIKEM